MHPPTRPTDPGAASSPPAPRWAAPPPPPVTCRSPPPPRVQTGGSAPAGGPGAERERERQRGRARQGRGRRSVGLRRRFRGEPSGMVSRGERRPPCGAAGNLAELAELDEEALLGGLRERFLRQQVYVSAGGGTRGGGGGGSA